MMKRGNFVPLVIISLLLSAAGASADFAIPEYLLVDGQLPPYKPAVERQGDIITFSFVPGFPTPPNWVCISDFYAHVDDSDAFFWLGIQHDFAPEEIVAAILYVSGIRIQETAASAEYTLGQLEILWHIVQAQNVALGLPNDNPTPEQLEDGLVIIGLVPGSFSLDTLTTFTTMMNGGLSDADRQELLLRFVEEGAVIDSALYVKLLDQSLADPFLFRQHAAFADVVPVGNALEGFAGETLFEQEWNSPSASSVPLVEVDLGNLGLLDSFRSAVSDGSFQLGFDPDRVTFDTVVLQVTIPEPATLGLLLLGGLAVLRRRR